MTLIKDLIEIPDYIEKGRFVLRLAEGVTRPEETLSEYVVTPELRACYEDAFSFIKSALQTKTSKASYLHGSFGSGKSHFMAVLHLILQGNPAARGIPELASVITKHNDWIAGKKFLLVPYHMIGAHDMESGILGGYVDFIRRTHPDAPIPGVYLAEACSATPRTCGRRWATTRSSRTLGGRCIGGERAGASWRPAWDAERVRSAAIAAPPGSEDRSQLVSALIGKFFGSYDTPGRQPTARHSSRFDKGLSVISKHAAGLGYDGLILFLDELDPLAGQPRGRPELRPPGRPEAGEAGRGPDGRTGPIPIVSFVARQRDLRELIGDTCPGPSG